MKFGLFYLPTIGLKSEIERGMAGQDNKLYQQMLRELGEQARLADELGYESIGFTEHHFHVEGYEISNNPVMLDLFVAMQTKRIKVGQLGIVLPAASPLRVAEDVAMLDHMSGGRAYAGFARGYQKRWVNTLGQLYHIQGTASDQSDVDRINREAYEEHYRIIKKAWTSDVFSYSGKYWQVPPPGIPWSHDATARVGRGQAADGTISELGIAPRCLQQPHPPLYQPFSFSEETIRWCAHEDITPIVLYTDVERLKPIFRIYQEESAKAGRELGYGEKMGVFRDCVVAPTDAEAKSLASNGLGYVWPEWFAPFGFSEALRRKDEPSSTRMDNFGDLYDRGFELVGSPDTVCRMIEKLQKELNLPYLLLWQCNGLVPHDQMMRSIEMFATKVMPKFAD